MMAAVDLAARPHLITDIAELRAILGEPTVAVQRKLADRLTPETVRLIGASPFLLIGTAHPDGGLDVSPRGDPAGFVRILDERTLLMPERPGNRLADALTNLLADPRVALLFLLPGQGVTFRVNGKAEITDDPELLGPSAVEGKVPRLGLLITVAEAYTQCPKAVMRSELWNPERHVPDAALPSHGEILRSLHPDFDPAPHDAERAERYARREGFY